ncbi:hypothetical protein IFM89_036966 [Coptis chinensis]|uniref:BRCT domain-containing protein n=1 Tax=Coptis chinensis TaxID=261450 RepID=A0A835HB57_9MAGN|nr:hypothetical protein IFM89_036966 [Coptis chinensis]
MAGNNSAWAPLQFPIGNCKVSVEGSSYSCSVTGYNLQIKVDSAAKIKVAVDGERDSSLNGLSFVLVNPKNMDSQRKCLLEEALKIYQKELPTMKFAANTGKESHFLERCVSSGKYCTLLLKLSAGGVFTEVIAALTYQIIPADTQYAEVPLAAVNSNYQHKGFETIAEVDGKGKVRRLPIKADIRKALSFPGGSSLMVSHLSENNSIVSNPSNDLEPNLPEFEGTVDCYGTPNSKLSQDRQVLNEVIPQIGDPRSQLLVEDGCSKDNKKCDGSSPRCGSVEDSKELDSFNVMDSDNLVTEIGAKMDSSGKHCTCSVQSAKRKTWETSCSSIKSKKVKGGHQIDYSTCYLNSEQDEGKNSCYKACSMSTSKDNYCMEVDGSDTLKNRTSKDKSCLDVVPKDALKNSSQAVQTADSRLVCVAENEVHNQEKILPEVQCHRITLMDIANDEKKSFLTKIIGNLGGAITSDGSVSTHVITGKARMTRNFCVALCSGAWVVSTNWLKESSRERIFLDELPFILQDEDYVSKYRLELKDAVLRAKACPRALLKGYDIRLAKHVQPSVNTLSDIVKAAGGNGKMREPLRTIFVACEEDMEEAMLAAKKGIWTFSSDWFMSCIMRQELDMQAPQFTESL